MEGALAEGERDGGIGDAAAETLRTSLAEQAPRRLGDYEVLEMIGRGGMGIVYKGRHAGLDRLIAIKTIRSGVLASPKDVQRFQREARAAAKLDHPNIVAIHDIGEQDGQHFYTMDYVLGKNLADLARNQPFSAGQAAAITAGVASAIQYAHERGVLHRDIKPANVILTPEQQPRVLDFGLALVVTDESNLTLSGTPVGSPSYMPPEQASGQSGNSDARSDVYSLGAMLYELLTGRPPFQGASALETLQLVIENEPISPRRLNPAVPRDLETICRKCLEKAPNRRYQTAQELADELERFARDEPILAHPVARTEKVWRWCRRKPAIAALATATTLLLVTLAIGSPIAAWRIASARDAERLQRQRAEQNADELVKSLYAADIRTGWQALQEDNLLLARESIYKYLPALGVPISSELPGAAVPPIDGLRAGVITRELLGWEWRHLWSLCQSDETFTLHGDGIAVRSAVFSPDSRLVATGRGKNVYVTDVETKKQLVSLEGFSDVIDNCAVAFSNDGKYLAAKGGTNILIWKVGDWGRPLQHLEGAANHVHGNAVVFSPDDRHFVTRVAGGLGVWDTQSWQKKLVPGGFGLGMYLRYLPDGKWLAASDWNNLKILDTDSFEVAREIPREQEGNFRMFSLDVSGKRGLVAAGYHDGIVRFWETDSWREVARFQPHSSFVFGLAFSPDGNLLVTGGGDRLIQLWDVSELTSGQSAAHTPEPLRRTKGNPSMDFPGRLPSKEGPKPLLKWKGHYAQVDALYFAPNGRSIISASKDGTAKFWNAPPRGERPGLTNVTRPAWFAPDGSRLITLNGDGRLHLLDIRHERDLGAISPNLFDSKAWNISRDGKVLALGTTEGQVEIWSLETGQKITSFPHVDQRMAHVTASGDALLVAAASERRPEGNEQATLRIWDVNSGKIAGTYTNAFGPLAFSVDRQRLISTRLDGSVAVWDLSNGRIVGEIEENFTWVGDLTLSPDGRFLVTGSEEPVVNISDLASGKRIDSLKGSGICVVGVAFTQDARTLATRTVDGVMRFWHAATRKEMFALGLSDRVNSFLFSPNGEYLAISRGAEHRGEQRMVLWRAPSFEEIIAVEKSKQRR